METKLRKTNTRARLRFYVDLECFCGDWGLILNRFGADLESILMPIWMYMATSGCIWLYVAEYCYIRLYMIVYDCIWLLIVLLRLLRLLRNTATRSTFAKRALSVLS